MGASSFRRVHRAKSQSTALRYSDLPTILADARPLLFFAPGRRTSLRTPPRSEIENSQTETTLYIQRNTSTIWQPRTMYNTLSVDYMPRLARQAPLRTQSASSIKVLPLCTYLRVKRSSDTVCPIEMRCELPKPNSSLSLYLCASSGCCGVPTRSGWFLLYVLTGPSEYDRPVCRGEFQQCGLIHE